MDRVTESLLKEFSDERGLTNLAEDKRFEHFVSFITVGRHYNESFDTADLLVGSATGIDAVATIVNGDLVTDAESLAELDEAGELDVTFVFVQADRGSGFDAAKLGNFGYAALDFFSMNPSYRGPRKYPQPPRSCQRYISEAASSSEEIQFAACIMQPLESGMMTPSSREEGEMSYRTSRLPISFAK